MQVRVTSDTGTTAIHIESERFQYVIWPDLGGIINQWTTMLDGQWFDLIHAFNSADDFRENLTSKGFPSCKLSPYVCRIRNSRYQFEGKEFKIGKFGYDQHHIHGLVYDLPFSVEEIRQEDSVVKVVLSCEYQASDEGFPFTYRLIVTYTFEENGTLTMHTAVWNTGAESMPLVDGWHPYFKLPGDLSRWILKTDARECLVLDSDLIPTGTTSPFDTFYHGSTIETTKLDHCLPLIGSNKVACSLIHTLSGIQLHAKSIKNYPYLQIFIPPERDRIAIEFLSGAPDAFNNLLGLQIIYPGEKMEFLCSYEIHHPNQK